MKKTLYLASQSKARQRLLRTADISFKLLEQDADETACGVDLSLEDLVQDIAKRKMAAVQMSSDIDDDECYVVTADTLVQAHNGAVLGKPASYKEAYDMVRLYREPVRVVTAFCCEKRVRCSGVWATHEQVAQTVCSTLHIDLPDSWITTYLEKNPVTAIAGALAVEGVGAQFVRSIEGSYTAIIGLPLCELRHALQHLGFFD